MEAPDLAAEIRSRFSARRHHVMATLRRDGSPRMSGTEVTFTDDDIGFGIMTGAQRARDLARDARMALHSQGDDPVDDAWAGEAKLAGRALAAGEIHGEAPPGTAYRLDITEAVLTALGDPADHLVITSWHPGRGVERIKRY